MKKILVLFSLLTSLSAMAQTNVEAGKTIFKGRCASCHAVNSKLVGPALKDVDKRRSLDWIIKFVHNSQNVIKSGDPMALSVFNENNQTIMPDHTDLKDDDIKNIIAYIKDEGSKAPTIANNSIARPSEILLGDKPITLNSWIFWLIGVLVVLLIFTFNQMINIKDVLKKNSELENEG